MDMIDRAYTKKLVNGLSSGYLSSSVTDNADGSKTLTINFVNGDKAEVTFSPVKGDKGDAGISVQGVKIQEINGIRHLIVTLDDGTELDAGVLPNEQYDDTAIKQDISDLQSDKQDKTDNTLDTTDKTVTGAINEIYGTQLDNVGFSSDYKNIILNRKNGLAPYTIPISAIIHNAKLTELNDIDSTDIGNGKTLVYDSATQKHKYVDITGTDELVKMEASTDAHYLSDLIDKSTIVNDNGTLKVKKLDGQNVSITEINYLKGLTMNVMDLVNMFSNGGVKIINTPVATYADLLTYDKSTLIDGISYLIYVLADETHDGSKTTYLIDKNTATPTYFGYADSHRDFTTNPIDLANEVTGKLSTSNIDVDNLWTLLTINDTYKTLTTNNEVFGTHGAKALYDELITSIGKKANDDDLTTHTGDTSIHVSSTQTDKWDKVTDKVDKTDIVNNLTSTDTDKPLSANQGKILEDKKLNKADVNTIEIINADNVNIKDFILEKCTDKNKIYYITARSTCTETPKTSTNYYMIVEKIGDFTIKVKAYELAGKDNIHVCTYRSDNSKWTEWAKVLSSSDITTTINSSSTDEQIPGAKTINDMLGSKYGKQSSSKLNNYTTILDWAKNNIGNSIGYTGQETFSDTPLGNTYGTLVCLGNAVTTGLLVIAYSNFNEPVYIRKIKGGALDTADWITEWRTICTTTVADTSVKEISSFANTDVSGVINYTVKNGICYVKLWYIESITAGMGKFLLNNGSLPKPACFDVGITLAEANGDGVPNAFAFVDNNGALIAHFYKANSQAYGSFSYPVAES